MVPVLSLVLVLVSLRSICAEPGIGADESMWYLWYPW